jgi:beta-galactosidase GanA
MMRGLRAGFVLLCLLVFNICLVARAGTVQIHDDQLWIDGQAQPQIYGAEIQYFRLRGGPGPNVPRAQVIALWNQALDRAVEAGMNAVSFYIPWDFH